MLYINGVCMGCKCWNHLKGADRTLKIKNMYNIIIGFQISVDVNENSKIPQNRFFWI